MVLPVAGAETRTACWEERSQVCGEIRLALEEVRRRTPVAGLHGTPGGRRQGPSSVGPQQALLLLLLLTALGQWAVELLQCTASLPGGSGQWKPAMHCPTAWGRWAVQLLVCRTVSLPRGSGQWNSCYALPHCLGAVGSATPAMPCLTAWGQWAVELLQCTATLPHQVPL